MRRTDTALNIQVKEGKALAKATDKSSEISKPKTLQETKYKLIFREISRSLAFCCRSCLNLPFL